MSDRALERFWEACGSCSPLQLSVTGRLRGGRKVHGFHRPFAVIGRDARSDLVLEHPQVSRRHAFVLVIAGRVFCLDLGSRSALSWGGVPRRSGWIEPGRRVEIGPFFVGVPDQAQGAAPTAEPREAVIDPLTASPIGSVRDRERLPGIMLESAEPSVTGPVRWAIDRMLTPVGRAAECLLRLSDLSVSRYHCVLIRSGEDLWVVDLLGRKGTFVNETSVRWARLEDGSRLTLGRYQFVVRVESPPTLRVHAFDPPPLALPGIVPAPSSSGPMPSSSPSPTEEPRPRSTLASAPIRLPSTAQNVAPALRAALPDTLPMDADWPQATRLAEAMLAPVLDQFALMQQQMFEHYHQSMMQMMAAFGQMHQTREEFVERELEEIRRLTREVRALHRELERDQGGESPESPGTSGHEATADPGTSAPPTPPTGGPSEPVPSDRPAPHRPDERLASSTPRGTPEDYREAHSRLIERMTSLQQERQSRWQRLLGYLAGRGEDDEG